MIAPFDLFRTETDGSVKWLGVCADLDAAKARVMELSVALPGEYFIFSQTTGNRLFIKPDGQSSERPTKVSQFFHAVRQSESDCVLTLNVLRTNSNLY
jgi:hypothetical protein